MKKKLTLLVAFVLVFALGVAGTFAYLTAETQSITNTFTVGNIDIALTETFNTDADKDNKNDSWSNKLIPGQVYTKDPTVTVKANSEPCYLFLKVDANSSWDNYIDYSLNTTVWTAVPDHTGYYYRTVDTSTENQDFNVLTSNQVTVKTSVTKAVEDGITAGTITAPAITFMAAAVQSANVADLNAAWNALPATFTGTT